jgi:hypothetical protein
MLLSMLVSRETIVPSQLSLRTPFPPRVAEANFSLVPITRGQPNSLIENENLLLLRFFPSIPLPAAWRATCGCRTSSAAVILQE